MITVEFKSKIKNNRIEIPDWIQSKIKLEPKKDVRVILFLEEADKPHEDDEFKQAAVSDFFKGYMINPNDILFIGIRRYCPAPISFF